ncbi:MAG: nucleotidyltransferase family protein, partial [Bacteroidota bacterium]|nr:nucleotidyltransferase family protein [Bacteroidota bacterium]
KKMYNQHLKNNAIATLAVQDRKSSRKLYFSENNYLCKWKNEKTGEEKISLKQSNLFPFAFSGIQIINPEIFEYMHSGKYSIIDTYLKVAKTKKISFFNHTKDSWKDMGTPESFLK